MRRETRSQITKAPTQRQLRVGELIRAALAELFAHYDLFEPALSKTPLTVTEVRVTPDLKQAIAFVMPLGGQKSKEILDALSRVRKTLRTEVAARIQLRHAPDIQFKLDDSFERAAEVDALLRKAEVARDLARTQETEDQGEDSGDGR